MFFADKNGAYHHNGNTPVKISESIQIGGDLNKFDGLGTDNIDNLNWSQTGGNKLLAPPKVIFDSSLTSVLFIVTFEGHKALSATEGAGLTSENKLFVWAYTIENQRWDLWELAEDETLGKPFIGSSGEVMLPIGSSIYEHRGGPFKKDYTWISKKITMNEDSIVKVFNKIKINGVTEDLTSGGSYRESSDRLLIATSSGNVSNSDITYSSSATDYSEYRVTGTNKKGRWVQVKLEDMTKPVDSLGIIYRRKSTK